MDEWSFEWPTEPGNYWFCGWCFGHDGSKPELHYVAVWKNRELITYVTEGNFLFKSNKVYGMWLKCKLPQLPKLEKP